MKLPLFFISDIHLRLTVSDDESEKRKHLINFISHVADEQGTLFVVGDLFDFWFEYKYVIPHAYFDVLTSLHQARLNGVDIFFIPGNHDFWTRDFTQETIFSEIYPDGVSLEESSGKFLIIHGDGLLSWDFGYRTFRKIIRSSLFTWLYRWIHPDIGYAIGRWISRTGRHPAHTKEYDDRVIADLTEYAVEKFRDGMDYIIMGHYHQVKKIKINGGTLVILGDWLTHRSFGYFDGKEFSLNYWR